MHSPVCRRTLVRMYIIAARVGAARQHRLLPKQMSPGGASSVACVPQFHNRRMPIPPKQLADLEDVSQAKSSH